LIPKPKNKDRLEETNKQKTKVKPNIHKFGLKPSGLFQKMFFLFYLSFVVFFSVEDLTEATSCKSYCIFLLKRASSRKDSIFVKEDGIFERKVLSSNSSC
jgi:hypothetical protein